MRVSASRAAHPGTYRSSVCVWKAWSVFPVPARCMPGSSGCTSWIWPPRHWPLLNVIDTSCRPIEHVANSRRDPGRREPTPKTRWTSCLQNRLGRRGDSAQDGLGDVDRGTSVSCRGCSGGWSRPRLRGRRPPIRQGSWRIVNHGRCRGREGRRRRWILLRSRPVRGVRRCFRTGIQEHRRERAVRRGRVRGPRWRAGPLAPARSRC